MYPTEPTSLKLLGESLEAPSDYLELYHHQVFQH
jgi:hypothetical protein